MSKVSVASALPHLIRLRKTNTGVHATASFHRVQGKRNYYTSLVKIPQYLAFPRGILGFIFCLSGNDSRKNAKHPLEAWILNLFPSVDRSYPRVPENRLWDLLFYRFPLCCYTTFYCVCENCPVFQNISSGDKYWNNNKSLLLKGFPRKLHGKGKY